jgi:hypothetical protein
MKKYFLFLFSLSNKSTKSVPIAKNKIKKKFLKNEKKSNFDQKKNSKKSQLKNFSRNEFLPKIGTEPCKFLFFVLRNEKMKAEEEKIFQKNFHKIIFSSKRGKIDGSKNFDFEKKNFPKNRNQTLRIFVF